MTILNLGGGTKQFDGALNVDITPGDGVDIVADLSAYPWPWPDSSVDGIHISHVIEHFPDPAPIIRECHRVLKKGGFLRIVVPHCSSLSSVGCIGHYRTYSADTLHRYLDQRGRHDCYLFHDIQFKTQYYYLNWLWEEAAEHGYVNFPAWSRGILPVTNYTLTKIINISHRMFERFYWPLTGGASEVVWKGIKV